MDNSLQTKLDQSQVCEFQHLVEKLPNKDDVLKLRIDVHRNV